MNTYANIMRSLIKSVQACYWTVKKIFQIKKGEMMVSNIKTDLDIFIVRFESFEITWCPSIAHL